MLAICSPGMHMWPPSKGAPTPGTKCICGHYIKVEEDGELATRLAPAPASPPR
jgi:hypothetical protein